MIQSSIPGLCMSFNLVKSLMLTTIVATVSSEQTTARSIGALFRSPPGGAVVGDGEFMYNRSQRASRFKQGSLLKEDNEEKSLSLRADVCSLYFHTVGFLRSLSSFKIKIIRIRTRRIRSVDIFVHRNSSFLGNTRKSIVFVPGWMLHLISVQICSLRS